MGDEIISFLSKMFGRNLIKPPYFISWDDLWTMINCQNGNRGGS